MANPTDIELSVNLSADDIKNSAKDLQKSIQEAFDKSTGKTLDKNLESIKKQMSSTAVKSNELMRQMEKLESTKIPTKDFVEIQKQINADSSALAKLTEQLDQAWTKFNAKPVVQSFNEIDTELGKLTEKYGELSKYTKLSGDDLTKTLMQNFKAEDALKIGPVIRQYAELKKQFDSAYASSPIEKLTAQIEELENSLKYAKGELQDLKETGQDFTMGSDTEQYSKLADNLANVNNQSRLLITRWREQTGESDKAGNSANRLKSIMQTLSQVMRIVGNSIKNTFRSIPGYFKSAINSAKKLISTIAQIPAHFKRASRSSQSFDKVLKRGLTTILKYGLGIRSFYFLFRKIRTAISDGIKNVVLWEGANGQLNKSLSMLSSSLATLKNSMGAMMVPLINSLAPAISKIIDLINIAIQKITMFISALTGKKTYLQASKVNKNFADSLDKTGKSAKDAKKALDGYLGSFDELNNVSSKNDTDSGAGGADTGSFKETPIDQGILDLIEKLKKMWELGDFTELGREIGEKLRDFLESIPWKKIQDTAEKLGKSLATLINGFVEVERLGYDIGKTIAESINTIFHFVHGFVHALHWDSIGKFIGETFNGFFENIDWPLIYDTVITGMDGISQAIQTFIDTFHWDNLSTFIINGINTIVDGIKAFVDGIDWGDLGSKLGEQLRKTISGIGWYDVGQAIGAILQAAIDFVHDFISELNVDQIRTAVKNLIDGFFARVDSKELGETIAKIINMAIDIVKGIWEDNKDTFKEEGKKLFEGFFSEIDTADLADAVWFIIKTAFIIGIAKAIPSILSFVSSKLLLALTQTILKGLGSLIGKVGSLFTTLGKTITGGIKSAFAKASIEAELSGAGSLLSQVLIGDMSANLAAGGALAATTLVTAIVGGVTAAFGGAEIGKLIWKALYPDELDDLEKKYSGIKGTIQLFADFADAAWYEVSEAGKTFVERTKEHLENLGENLTLTGDGIHTFGAGVGIDMTELASKVSEKITDIKNRFSEWASDLEQKKNDIKAKLIDMKNNASENFASIKEKLIDFTTKWTERFTDAKAKLNDFVTNAREKFNSFKDIVVKCFEGIKNGIKTPINAALGFVEKFVNGIIDGINGIGDKLKNFNINVPDWVPEIGGKEFKMEIPKINHVTIPKLAQGAVIPPNKEFLAMLGDQSHGTNIEAPLDTLVEAFNAANKNGNEQEIALLQEQNNLLRQLLQKEFGISERDIYRSVRRQDSLYRNSTGQSGFVYA